MALRGCKYNSFKFQVSGFAAIRRRHPSRLGIDKRGLFSASMVFAPPSVPPLSGDRNTSGGCSSFIFLGYKDRV